MKKSIDDKYYRAVTWSLKRKIIFALFIFIFTNVLIGTIQVYAYTTQNDALIAGQQKSLSYQYYMIAKQTSGSTIMYFVIYGNDKIHYWKDNTNKDNLCAVSSTGVIGTTFYFTYAYENQTFNTNSVVTRSGTDTYSFGTTTAIFEILYSNYDVYLMNNNGSYAISLSNTLKFATKTEDEPLNLITAPSYYSADGTISTHPYYVISSGTGALADKIFFNVSNEPYFIDTDGYLQQGDSYYYMSSDGGQTWDNKVHYGNSTRVLITEDSVLYNNNDIYRTNVANPSYNTDYNKVKYAKTTELVIPKNPLPNVTPITYTYEYSPDVEDVKDLKIQKDAWYRTDWGLAIAESKTDYVVNWTRPETSGLLMEISFQSKFSSKIRRYEMQTYKKSWSMDRTITPEDETFKFNINTIGKILLKNCWNDVDTGSWYAIPPTEMYFRYVSLDSTEGKAYYGNWYRFDFRSGSQGIIDTEYETKVTTNESYNPETGEIEYNDIIMEGSQNGHINSSGEEVDESQSFDAALDTLDNAVNTTTDAFKEVGPWLGSVPELLGTLFTFLPPEVTTILALGITLIVILRIAGR